LKYISKCYKKIVVFSEQWVIDGLKALREKMESDASMKNEAPSTDEATTSSDKVLPTLFTSDMETLKKQIDYIITLGGDGTILWAAK